MAIEADFNFTCRRCFNAELDQYKLADAMSQAVLKSGNTTHSSVRGLSRRWKDESHLQNPSEKVETSAPSILLLQGPVGPFFMQLQSDLEASGFSVRRFTFNAADELFAPRAGTMRFAGTLAEWELRLREELCASSPNFIILFGCARPAHEVARKIADEFGIIVISLEEGYLRSGYVTCEIGGNNNHSKLALTKPVKERKFGWRAKLEGPASGAASLWMGLWATIYYVIRDLVSSPSDEHLFHRPKETLVFKTYCWGAHLMVRLFAKLTEAGTKYWLRRHPGYILIPLQVSTDSQLGDAARGWTTKRLVEASLRALSNASEKQVVVFKLHPLEPQSAKIKSMIKATAKQMQVDARRLSIIHTGRIGDLVKNSSGMVAINSTSVFSALHRRVPVLVLGDAVYRHNEVVTVGNSEHDVNLFFRLRHSKAAISIASFIRDVHETSLIAGDFYSAGGRKLASVGILRKLVQLQSGFRHLEATE